MPEAGTELGADLFLDPARRDLEPRAGQIGHCRMLSQRKSIDEENRTIDFVCSTATVDRYGEIVLPSAFEKSVAEFMRNPAFPYNHDYQPLGDRTPTVGHWRSLRVTKDALLGTAWFKPRGLGEDCWRDYLEGNLTSVSVAFITRAWEMQQMKIGGEQRGVRVFTEVDLLEISAVLIPANPEARIRAASHAADEPALKRLQTLIERLEYVLDTGPEDLQRGRILDDADASRGLDGWGDGYFGDIPDADVPEPRAASQGESELKDALAACLAVRSGQGERN